MNKVRNMNFGWIVVLLGAGFILTGLNMKDSSGGTGSLICFDPGCVTVQGYSCMALGLLMIGYGLYIRYFRYK